jgi:hypothetical protein
MGRTQVVWALQNEGGKQIETAHDVHGIANNLG